jgi:large subunit ribosomal protein L36
LAVSRTPDSAIRRKPPMKVRSSIKRRTKDCQIVIRKGKRFVINKKNKRLKQRQG